MNQFIVPQFIDVEDKIFGPITVRQFVLIVIGGIIIFLSFRFGDLPFFLFMTLLVGGGVALFGFVKVNGAFFHQFLLNVLASLKRPNLRVWNKTVSEAEIRAMFTKPWEAKPSEILRRKEVLTTSRLTELSLIVDTRGEYKGE